MPFHTKKKVKKAIVGRVRYMIQSIDSPDINTSKGYWLRNIDIEQYFKNDELTATHI